VPLTSPGQEGSSLQLPWTFDTTTVWHTIIKAAFGLNALLGLGLILKLLGRRWLDAAGLCVAEAMVAGFTVIFVRHQEGSRGTLFRDRLTVEPNTVLGVPLPGPRGSYPLHQFRTVEVEFRAGRPSPSPNAARPHELVWLMGGPERRTSCWHERGRGPVGGSGRRSLPRWPSPCPRSLPSGPFEPEMKQRWAVRSGTTQT
jgi:hypothetical protein